MREYPSNPAATPSNDAGNTRPSHRRLASVLSAIGPAVSQSEKSRHTNVARQNEAAVWLDQNEIFVFGCPGSEPNRCNVSNGRSRPIDSLAVRLRTVVSVYASANANALWSAFSFPNSDRPRVQIARESMPR